MSKEGQSLPKIYTLSMEYTSEFNMVRKMILLFSSRWKIEGMITHVIRDRLATLLTIYLLEGYSKESKLKAAEILGIKMNSINSMNLELRKNNYIVKDDRNTRKSHLNRELLLLKEYIENTDNGESFMLFRGKCEGVTSKNVSNE